MVMGFSVTAGQGGTRHPLEDPRCERSYHYSHAIGNNRLMQEKELVTCSDGPGHQVDIWRSGKFMDH